MSSGFDRQVLVWDGADGRLRCAFPSHDSVTITIAFHPSGELLATGDNDHEVRLWDVAPVALDEPFEVYLTCYRVLEASSDVRAASLLRRADQGKIEPIRFSARLILGPVLRKAA